MAIGGTQQRRVRTSFAQERQTRASSQPGVIERTIFGRPARFMKPLIVLVCVSLVMALYGVLMIYSASSVTALTSKALGYNAFYYAQRQIMFIGIALGMGVFVNVLGYQRFFTKPWLATIFFGMVLALILVHSSFAGEDAYGASRWISLGPMQLQPSEFSKIGIIILFSFLVDTYIDQGNQSTREFALRLVVCIVVPLFLIYIEPDKGSTAIIGVTLWCMAYVAGFDRRWLFIVLVVAAGAFMLKAVSEPYSLKRILTALFPYDDPTGDGYQLIQGFNAFGSGGIFGVGFGMSHQKYSYLPMAYNDFIFAIIGEENGLVGTLAVLGGFSLIAWAGFQIARYASDLKGRLTAAGITVILVFQLFVNIFGVLGIAPLTGKPIPFLSYGGSTIMATIIMVSFLVSISWRSQLPETEHDRNRASWQTIRGGGSAEVVSSRRASVDSSQARTPASVRSSSGMRLIQTRSSHTGSVARSSSGGYQRINLGPSSAERLRDAGQRARTQRSTKR